MKKKSGDNGSSEEREPEGVPRRKFLKGLAAAGAAGVVVGYFAPHVQAAPSTELVLQDDYIQMKALAADPSPVPQGGLWYRSDQAAFFGSPDGAAGVVPLVFSAGVSNLGNTQGDTKVQPGQLVLQGGNNITLSEITGASSKMTVIISGGAGGAGGIALADSLQTATSGTVVFANSNNVTFGMSGSTRMTASYTAPVVSSALQTVGSATGSGTNTSRFAADDHAHAGLGQFQISGNTSNTSNVVFGSLVLAGGNNITLSQVSVVGAASVTISAFNQSVQTQGIQGLAGGTQTATSGTILFADSNGLSFGMSLSTRITASYSRNVASNALQDVGTATGSGTNTSRFAADDHIHRGVIGLDVNAIASTFYGTAQLSAGAMMSIATGGASTRASFQFIDLWSSATTASQVTTGNVVGAMASRVALEGHQHAGVHGLILSGTASTFLGDFTFNSGAMISFATAGNSTAGSGSIINLWSSATTASSVATANAIGAMASRVALEGHQHGGVPTISLVGNTSGTTTQGNLSLVLAGGPNVTLSASTNPGIMTVSFSAPAPGAAAVELGMSNIGNTAGTTGTVNSRMLVVGGPNITVSQSIAGQNATLSISGAAGGGGGATLSQLVLISHYGASNINASIFPGNGSIQLFPLNVAENYSFSQFAVSISFSLSTSSNSSHGGTLSVGIGFYTRNASTLSLATSGLGTYAWTNTSDSSTVSLSGLREVTGTFANMNLTPGNYWVGFWSQTSTVNANWFTASNILHATGQSQSVHSGDFMAAAAGASFQPAPLGQGTFSATSNALPVSMAFSNITGSIRWWYRPHLAFMNFTL